MAEESSTPQATQKIICIVGPTASGKTALGAALSKKLGGEVVSADSMQVYKHMDIGTAKPTADEMQGVPHHMLDVCEPDEDYSVARYVNDAETCVQDIFSRKKLPVIVGGSGLYLDALVSGRSFTDSPETGMRDKLSKLSEEEGIETVREILRINDPVSYNTLHPNDKKRIIRAAEVFLQTGQTISSHNEYTAALPLRYDAVKIGLTFTGRELLYERINRRVDIMVKSGLFDEVERLLPRFNGSTAMQAIGYKEPAMYLSGQMSREDAIELLKRQSRRYAKRQLTWLRRDESIHWIERDGLKETEILEKALKIAEIYL